MQPNTIRLMAWMLLVPVLGSLLSKGGTLSNDPTMGYVANGASVLAFLALRHLASRREREDREAAAAEASAASTTAQAAQTGQGAQAGQPPHGGS